MTKFNKINYLNEVAKINISDYISKKSKRYSHIKQVYPDIIIVDPPRKGLDKNTIKNILVVEPKKLVYISCNPATMIRDISMLEEKYEVCKDIQPLDMFPYTSHCEVVSVLKLK